jgi:hypothetical protein
MKNLNVKINIIFNFISLSAMNGYIYYKYIPYVDHHEYESRLAIDKGALFTYLSKQENIYFLTE